MRPERAAVELPGPEQAGADVPIMDFSSWRLFAFAIMKNTNGALGQSGRRAKADGCPNQPNAETLRRACVMRPGQVSC